VPSPCPVFNGQKSLYSVICFKIKVYLLILQNPARARSRARIRPESPERPLMKATNVHGIIKTGSTINRMEITGIPEKSLPKTQPSQQIKPVEVVVEASWNNKLEEPAKSGSDASVLAVTQKSLNSTGRY
jgi:hypothetical protein